MIEILLQAERALTSGMLDQAERLYRQAIAADPRNSIAIVGLARVALERRDDLAAYEFSRRALAVDPDNTAAQRLVTRMAEVLELRGELPAGSAAIAPTPAVGRPATGAAAPRAADVAVSPAATQSNPAGPAATAARPAAPVPATRAGLLRRLTGRG